METRTVINHLNKEKGRGRAARGSRPNSPWSVGWRRQRGTNHALTTQLTKNAQPGRPRFVKLISEALRGSGSAPRPGPCVSPELRAPILTALSHGAPRLSGGDPPPAPSDFVFVAHNLRRRPQESLGYPARKNWAASGSCGQDEPSLVRPSIATALRPKAKMLSPLLSPDLLIWVFSGRLQINPK
jgi:hypothetical protein